MPTDGKYGRITTEKGDIPDDEPVFLLRAKDALAIGLVFDYARDCEDHGCPKDHVDGAFEAAYRFRKWQSENRDKMKLPD